MAKLSALHGAPREIECEFGDDVLKMKVATWKISPKFLRDMEAIEKDDQVGALSEYLSALILDWDAQDEDGNPVRPDKDVFDGLGLEVLARLSEAINEAMANPKN